MQWKNILANSVLELWSFALGPARNILFLLLAFASAFPIARGLILLLGLEENPEKQQIVVTGTIFVVLLTALSVKSYREGAFEEETDPAPTSAPTPVETTPSSSTKKSNGKKNN